jgi:Fe-S oxidoreductase
MWMEETSGSQINANRTREILESGADTLAVACPFCMVMLSDGLADAGAGERVTTLDLAEIVAGSLVLPPRGDPSRQLPVVQ